MRTKKILILEDDLETVSIIFRQLALLEDKVVTTDNPVDFSVSVLSEYSQVEELVNRNDKNKYDLVLLDRDCKAGGSFHVFEIEKFGADKIISISSIPQYNEDAQNRGVSSIVHKTYNNMDKFAEQVINEIEKKLVF